MPSRTPAPSAAPSRTTRRLDLPWLREFVHATFEEYAHAARLESIANATAGLLEAAVVGVHAIGAAYAALICGDSRHGIKQVDRLLSNDGFDLEALAAPWVDFVIAKRTELVVVLDWTDFEADDQTTLCLYLLTDHGRATPLLWKTVPKSTLAGTRNEQEYALIERLHGLLPEKVGVTVLADRGFGDQKLYALLETLGWDYVIRFRQNILVEDAEGTARSAGEWVGDGRARKLVGARVTADRAPVAAVVTVHARNMKEPWCLATSLSAQRASEVVALYGRRFTIEESFRDAKDLHFGLGLRATHIRRGDRRDRMLFLVALAVALLTLLGAASEATGLDRTLKANTVKKRTHSLFRQGLYWYHALPHMKPERTKLLMTAFDKILREHRGCAEILGVI